MKAFPWKKWLPHIIAIALFLLVAIVYCKPVLDGLVTSQGDVIHWRGMVQQMQQYKDTHGHFPLWSNSMFGGMPGYQIALEPTHLLPLAYGDPVLNLFLPKPISFFFLLCLSFYFLTQVFGAKSWIGVLGALAYAYASFDPILVVAGHDTEIRAMGYVPFLLGAVLLIYQRRYWLGAALAALFTYLLVSMNHLQITYYFILVAAFMTVFYAVRWIRAKEYKHLALAMVFTGCAAVAGILCNAMTLWTTYDYSKATMRNGGLALDTATNTVKKSTGLPIDYAFDWSEGKAETFTLVVPDVYGGASQPLGEDSKLMDAITEKNIPSQAAQYIYQEFPSYWGGQRFTSGPPYLGAVMIFLCLFGVVYAKDKNKIWLIAITVLAILMSWGKNLELFNDFLFYHLPLYNKFRVPTMTLYIPQLTVPLLAILGIQQLFSGKDDKAYILKKFKTTLIVSAALFVVLLGLYAGLDYHAPSDQEVQAQVTQMARGDDSYGRAFVSAAASDRKALFGADLFRSLAFFVLAALVVWAFIKGWLKWKLALAGLSILAFVDLIMVDTRYLNYDSYLDKDEFSSALSPTQADQEISRDTSYYRVFNLTTDPWADANTPYYHNSVGGYHPAKLALIQDLINYQLSKQPLNLQVLNMLNVKYFIVPNPQTRQPVVDPNPDALGPCWFVRSLEYVPGPLAAMRALDHFDPKDTAVVQESFKADIPFPPSHDSSAAIHLLKNDNDEITYASSSKSSEFAVFSEIYYNRGWKAYVDGKATPIVQVDYLLRGLPLPAGDHNIRFEFRPRSYYTGEKVAMVSNWIVLLLIVGVLAREVYRATRKAPGGSKTA